MTMTTIIKRASPLLVAALTQLASVETEIAEMEEALKDRKALRKYIGENVLTELIEHEQLNNGALMPDDTEVTFEVEYHASVPAAQREAAHAYLIATDRADVLKVAITATVPRGELDLAEKITSLLRLIPSMDVEVTTILPGPTLTKYVRETLEAGDHLPEYFGVYAPVRAIPAGTRTTKVTKAK